MKTFYIAGSSVDRREIADLGNTLRHYGLRWFSSWDWTRFHLRDLANPLACAGALSGDIQAATGCDLFVLYTKVDGKRSMSWAEFGARLSSSKEAHVIHNGYDNVFWRHPCVKAHPTWDSFLEWLVSDQNLKFRIVPGSALPKSYIST